MRNKKVLSPFPYYGGKAKMAQLISEIIDYSNTTLYIEPFGGGCRCLLNKPPHNAEIYNDFGYGLTNFFEVMTSRKKTEQLICMLLDNPPSREDFENLVISRMGIEDRLNTLTNAEVSSLALNCQRKYNLSIFKDVRAAIRKEDYEAIIGLLEVMLESVEVIKKLSLLEEQQFQYYLRLYKEFWTLIEDKPEDIVPFAEEDFKNAWEQMIGIPKSGTDEEAVYHKMKKQYVQDCIKASIDSYTNDIVNSNELSSTTTEIEVAYVIFKLYYSSRDGMGTAWSNEKNKDLKAYYRAVRNLRNVSDRLQNVFITQCDALDLVRQYRTNSEVMLYLDPSYLKPEDEHLNLGEVYKMSYTYQDHKKLLEELIKPDTKAKVLISNYDVDLYNKYLCDWDKVYYKTFTGVGSKKGNRRLEVLWKNY